MANYPVEKKKLKKKILRELKLTKREKRIADAKVRITRKSLARLEEIIENLKHFRVAEHEGVYMKSRDVPDWVNGIWVVGERNSAEVTFFKFSDFLREVTNYPKFKMNLPTSPMLGSDGKEVTFRKGDLLVVRHESDVKEGHVGFHFANVAPSDGITQLQYELVLHRLGMGAMPCTDPKSFLVVDGNFRKVN